MIRDKTFNPKKETRNKWVEWCRRQKWNIATCDNKVDELFERLRNSPKYQRER